METAIITTNLMPPINLLKQDILNSSAFRKTKYGGSRVEGGAILVKDWEGNEKMSLELEVTTQKSVSGVWYTRAQVYQSECKGNYSTKTMLVFGDYSSVMDAHHDLKRGTEKALMEAHIKTINEVFEKVYNEVKQHYNL